MIYCFFHRLLSPGFHLNVFTFCTVMVMILPYFTIIQVKISFFLNILNVFMQRMFKKMYDQEEL
jgi:hypothetical protein